MARIFEPTPKMERRWRKWVSSRPPNVRAVAERLNPWTLYRLNKTGDRATLISLTEHDDGAVTLTVAVTGQFNFTLFDREVFGINPADLEECDLPSESEMRGTVLTSTQVHDNIDALRVMVRPDLWTMGADGIARRKDN